MNPTVIEVFADIVCPFAHVGLRRFVDRRAELGRDDVHLHIRAFPLEVVNGAPMEADAVAHKAAELRRQVSPDLFADFDASAFPSTSLPALALTHAAYGRDTETGERMALRLRALTFDDGVDVSRPEVLAGLVDEFGLEPPGPDDEAAVHADLAEARSRGVIGSPHFFTPTDDMFCPTLDLRKAGDQLDIAVDYERFEGLLDACFR